MGNGTTHVEYEDFLTMNLNADRLGNRVCTSCLRRRYFLTNYMVVPLGAKMKGEL